MTPENKTAISTTTSTAAIASTPRPSTESMAPATPPAAEGRPVAVVSPAVITAIASGELADSLLEQGPGFVAEALLPLVVEARLTQLGAERIRLGAVEGEALRSEVGLDGVVQLLDVLALLDTCIVDGSG